MAFIPLKMLTTSRQSGLLATPIVAAIYVMVSAGRTSNYVEWGKLEGNMKNERHPQNINHLVNIN